ncbi:MAG: hypothetical protein OCD01_15305 [Fibrobacterales bacterium]
MAFFCIYTTLFADMMHPTVSIKLGGGYQRQEPTELNRATALLSKKINNLDMGVTDFSMGAFSHSFYGTSEVLYHFSPFAHSAHIVAGIGIDYWSASFSQANTFFSDTDNNTFSSTLCNDALTITSGGNGVSGCFNASQHYTFVPLWFSTGYRYSFMDIVSVTLSGNIGILIGNSELTIEEYTLPAVDAPAQKNTLSFSLDPGLNPIYKIKTDFEIHPFSLFGISLSMGYQWIVLDHFTTTHVSGTSQIFDLALGKPLTNEQTLYIKEYRNLSSTFDEFTLLTDEQKGSALLNTVSGNFSGLFINIALVVSL